MWAKTETGKISMALKSWYWNVRECHRAVESIR